MSQFLKEQLLNIIGPIDTDTPAPHPRTAQLVAEEIIRDIDKLDLDDPKAPEKEAEIIRIYLNRSNGNRQFDHNVLFGENGVFSKLYVGRYGTNILIYLVRKKCDAIITMLYDDNLTAGDKFVNVNLLNAIAEVRGFINIPTRFAPMIAENWELSKKYVEFALNHTHTAVEKVMYDVICGPKNETLISSIILEKHDSNTLNQFLVSRSFDSIVNNWRFSSTIYGKKLKNILHIVTGTIIAVGMPQHIFVTAGKRKEGLLPKTVKLIEDHLLENIKDYSYRKFGILFPNIITSDEIWTDVKNGLTQGLSSNNNLYYHISGVIRSHKIGGMREYENHDFIEPKFLVDIVFNNGDRKKANFICDIDKKYVDLPMLIKVAKVDPEGVKEYVRQNPKFINDED